VPRQVVTVAREYGANPLEALVAAGYLTAEEVASPPETPRALQLREFTELELSIEMMRRVAARNEESSLLEAPLDADHPAMQAIADEIADRTNREN
jgi:hypothetical protein